MMAKTKVRGARGRGAAKRVTTRKSSARRGTASARATAEPKPPVVLRAEQLSGDKPTAIGEMARMVAHEVRNALSVMYNVGTSLRRVVPKTLPDTEMLLGILEEELARLDRLTRDLVSFATPAPPVRANVRIRDLLDRAVIEARMRCPGGPRATVLVEVAPDAATASLDPERMLEALVGLLRNGIEASNGRGKVRVVASRDAQALRIAVIDEGPGIPAGEAERIFDPFYSTKPSGIGLGLALCRQIARRHGGDLTAGPAPDGTGAAFRLEIPIDEGAGG
jgi:signal transduction histidine kinase